MIQMLSLTKILNHVSLLSAVKKKMLIMIVKIRTSVEKLRLYFLKSQLEILELKSTICEIKNSLDDINAGV